MMDNDAGRNVKASHMVHINHMSTKKVPFQKELHLMHSLPLAPRPFKMRDGGSFGTKWRAKGGEEEEEEKELYTAKEKPLESE